MKAVIALFTVAFLASVSSNEYIECEDQASLACFVEPCKNERCPNVAGAVCKNNLCDGGCDTKWFLGRDDVTEKCS